MAFLFLAFAASTGDSPEYFHRIKISKPDHSELKSVELYLNNRRLDNNFTSATISENEHAYLTIIAEPLDGRKLFRGLIYGPMTGWARTPSRGNHEMSKFAASLAKPAEKANATDFTPDANTETFHVYQRIYRMPPAGEGPVKGEEYLVANCFAAHRARRDHRLMVAETSLVGRPKPEQGDFDPRLDPGEYVVMVLWMSDGQIIPGKVRRGLPAHRRTKRAVLARFVLTVTPGEKP